MLEGWNLGLQMTAGRGTIAVVMKGWLKDGVERGGVYAKRLQFLGASCARVCNGVGV